MSDRKQALLADLAAARGEALATVQRLRPGDLDRPTANPGWSVKDTLAHLASIEARLRAMWQHAVEGRAGPLPGPSLDDYNAACVAERRGWALGQIAAELDRATDETRRFVEGLAPDALDRRWTHPTRGEVTVESLLEIEPRHLREHLAQVQAATGT